MDNGNGADNASRRATALCAASHVTEISTDRMRAIISDRRLRKIFAFARARWAAAQMSLKDASGSFSSLHMIRALCADWNHCDGSIEQETARRFEPALICPYQFLDFCPARGSNADLSRRRREPKFVVFIR
jgi:hypothetical protein